jgi:SAM-dependent methyltransferase
MVSTIWEHVWKKRLITSDYSLKYINFMRGIEKTLQPGSDVLEAGCGSGQTLSIFSARHETVGLDLSPAALLLARGHAHTVIRGDIFQLPFRENSFDLVYNSGVIEHFPEPRNISAVREMARVTKPAGRLIIIVPNTLCLWYRTGKFVARSLKKFEFGYEEDYSVFRLKKMLAQADLQVLAVFGLQCLPPLATNDRELINERWRRIIGTVEDAFPFREYYAYALGAIAGKVPARSHRTRRKSGGTSEPEKCTDKGNEPVAEEEVDQGEGNCLFRSQLLQSK